MRRILICLSFVFFHLSFSFAQQSINIVFIGNSITYGALHQQRELTAPPAQCARWLSQQEGIDTVYFKNCGRSGRTTYHFLPRVEDVIPAGDKTYFGDVVASSKPGHVHIGDADAYAYFKHHYKTDVFEEKDARGRSYWLHPNEQGATRLAEFWGKAVLNLE